MQFYIFYNVSAIQQGWYHKLLYLIKTITNHMYIINLCFSANPAVYSTTSEIIVGSFADVKIEVYIDGDPKPSSHNITWFFNGDQLPDESYYSLENGNKDLVIRGYSSLTVGRYECRVSTSIGDNSVFVNVSYFGEYVFWVNLPIITHYSLEVLLIFTDPPIVTVSPKVVTVREGDTASFNCSASSIVDTVITWYRDGTDPSALTSDNGVLVITNVTRSDSGAYYCEAVDSEGIWTIQGEHVQLFVECMLEFHCYSSLAYPLVAWSLLTDDPTSVVGEPAADQQSSLSIATEEGVLGLVYLCSADGYPRPSLSWSFNGGDLPNGIIQTQVSESTHL